jgi:transposase, IS5 family
MKPKAKPRTYEQPLISTMRLDLSLDMVHPLVRLAEVMPWEALAQDFGPLYCADNGRPAVPIRLMAGLHFLKHMEGMSDEAVVEQWVERPYWQFFCGEEFFSVSPAGIRETQGQIQHRLPIDPSQMTRWRKRIGEAGMERLLKATIEVGLKTRTITEKSVERVIVDTTVQPKNVQHPTDARLYRKVHAAMLRIAEKEGITLRQSYRKMMQRAFGKHGGHAKAKQYGRENLHPPAVQVRELRLQR